jgi:hypothetical protein
MRLIRDDADQKLKSALVMIMLAKSSKDDGVRAQHLGQIERTLEMLLSSIQLNGAQGPNGEENA